jgi:NAD-dependent dihydropyrimidine dehydrogenase PreA subunit
MINRKIVHIDEDKCDGCGECVPSCQEGAIRIVDGKARLVSDIYCDGLGACLGHCPRGAIAIIERQSLPFDEAAVATHLKAQPAAAPLPQHHSGCPGSAARALPARLRTTPALTALASVSPESPAHDAPSGLANWPVQLHLVPPHAPYLQDAHLLLVADCVPFAYADFHRRFLDGRPVLIGCPKLDDGQFYVRKLADIFRQAGVRGVTVLHMEVPCCLGLVQIARLAVQSAGVSVPVNDVTITVQGEVRAQGDAPLSLGVSGGLGRNAGV